MKKSRIWFIFRSIWSKPCHSIYFMSPIETDVPVSISHWVWLTDWHFFAQGNSLPSFVHIHIRTRCAANDSWVSTFNCHWHDKIRANSKDLLVDNIISFPQWFSASSIAHPQPPSPTIILIIYIYSLNFRVIITQSNLMCYSHSNERERIASIFPFADAMALGIPTHKSLSVTKQIAVFKFFKRRNAGAKWTSKRVMISFY